MTDDRQDNEADECEGHGYVVSEQEAVSKSKVKRDICPWVLEQAIIFQDEKEESEVKV